MKFHPGATVSGFVLGGVGAVALVSLFWVVAPPVPPPVPPKPPADAAAPAAQPRTAAPASPRVAPAAVSVKTSFEEIERVSTQTDAGLQRKAELERFEFPALAFRWSGSPQSLAPAFLWETDQGRVFMGHTEVGTEPNAPALLDSFSGGLAIRVTGAAGRLRLHLNVVARLKDWITALDPAAVRQAQPISVQIEVPAPNSVILRTPPIGAQPGRAFIVGL